MNLIAISGKMQSGKNTVASIINKLTNNKYEEKCFADKLKNIVCLLIGCTREQLEDQEFKEKELGEEWTIQKMYDTGIEPMIETYQLTPRLLLQLLSTECGREILHPNIWVNALFVDYKVIGDNLLEGEIRKVRDEDLIYPNWIITDMRFPNELEAVKDRGGITIRVNRPCEECGVLEGHKMVAHKNKPSTHESETALDLAEFDFVIENSGSIEELIEKVKIILIELKVI